MATVAAPPPDVAAQRSLPSWLSNAIAQGGALLLAMLIALALGGVIILLYGENPLEVYGAILSFSFTRKDGLASNWIVALHEDASGTLWIGTNGEGVSRFRDGRTNHTGLPFSTMGV